MNRKLIAIAGAGLVATALTVGRCRRDRSPATLRDRMRDRRDAMRRRSPRGRMFANVEAIKADTEEILTLLREQRAGCPEHPEC